MLIKQKKIMIGCESNMHVRDETCFIVLSEETTLEI